MVQIIGLLIALIAAVLVGQDASKRGMNAVGWGIGVFLLLIIFLPLYFIMRKPMVDPNHDVLDQNH
jgi:4-amino-4-deoxy-L-arabinose transferase-like glycosyltransferase